MTENWKIIEDYPNYMVSDKGRVININRNKILKQHKTAGYLRVSLSNKGKVRHLLVHRLVAMAFLGTPPDGYEVNHKDRDKLNNSVDNLEWCSRGRNMEHAHSLHWTFLSPEGEVVNVYNLSKFCKENGLDYGNMKNLHYGNGTSCKGWRKTA